MKQFDVYENTNKLSKKQYPLLVDVQHAVLSSLATRIVPLSRKDLVQDAVMDILMPEVFFDERCFVLMTPQISAVPCRLLSNPIGTLEHCRLEVLAALDFAITGV